MTLHTRLGVDMSSFQAQPSFHLASEHILFLYHRSWMGDVGAKGKADPTFTTGRVHQIREAGIPFGPYCFARNAGNSGKEEARRFVTHAHSMGWGKKGDLPGALDIETGEGGHPGIKFVREFAREYRRLTGHRVVLYTGSFWRDMLHNPHVLMFSKLWLAAYTDSWHGWVPRAWKKPYIWQFTDHASVRGFEGLVDGDRFLRSEKAFQRMRLKHDLEIVQIKH